ncbi:phenylacetate--CoA ligase family protein [Nocardia sp. NPDC051052]|uniref:phenylacetate--CoA ligase family protein n=1 Tax=Nocardia sp. NPDC051052 TaxID=3364322 RepID=UPI0037AD54C3
MTVSLSLTAGGRPGFGRAIDVFHRAAREVPAYREFLARHGIDAESIQTADDFASVPATTKANYLQEFQIPSMLWQGDITQAGTWSTSSGSTGAPTYWPRDQVSLQESVEMYDRLFRNSFASHRRSTLLVVGFALGNWIGGTYTYRAALALRKRGHKISIIAPGINADTILANIAELGPHYEQVVIAGYPPFVKDILDRADHDVLRQDLKVLLAGENITEEWRDHILARIGKPDKPDQICLIYGTADAGEMGHETPTTIGIRRLARTDGLLAATLFGADNPLPTFVEFDPQFRYTEVDANGRLLFTVDSSLPLIRYQINDEGRVFAPWEVAEALRRCGHQLPVRTSTVGSGFMVLRRRPDIAASFYAVKLFPESVRAALEDSAVRDAVSGKFVLSTETDDAFGQTLHLRVELSAAALPSATLRELLARRVVAALDRTNSEYRQLHATIGAMAEPVITLDPFGSSRFRYPIKHNYLENK